MDLKRFLPNSLCAGLLCDKATALFLDVLDTQLMLMLLLFGGSVLLRGRTCAAFELLMLNAILLMVVMVMVVCACVFWV